MKIAITSATVLALVLLAYGGWVFYIQNVEKPAYKVRISDRNFELRDYPSLVVAEVSRKGDRMRAVSDGFGPLAAYIFAKKRDGEKIAMTAPVTQQSDTGEIWTVRFIMPSNYTLENLPQPDNAEVRLLNVPPKRVAAIRFSGVARDALVAKKEGELRTWMNARGIKPLGPATYAYYNDPFTVGFLRRNEVMFDVEGQE